jgi:hypothetical protein
MPIRHRQYLRFSLDVPAYLHGRVGEKYSTTLQQISVGGCLLPCRSDLFPGDEFRLEIGLPKGNFVPLSCKVIYCVEDMGMGAKFLEITKFEQELLSTVIQTRLESENLPLPCDPMTVLGKPRDRSNATGDPISIRESMLDDVMGIDRK